MPAGEGLWGVMWIPGTLEIVAITVVVMLLFGFKRLPDAARSLARSVRILRAETHALRRERDDPADPEPERGPDRA